MGRPRRAQTHAESSAAGLRSITWIGTQIDELLRIFLQVVKQRAKPEAVHVFPPAIESHGQPCFKRVALERLANRQPGIVAFAEHRVAPAGWPGAVQPRLQSFSPSQWSPR